MTSHTGMWRLRPEHSCMKQIQRAGCDGGQACKGQCGRHTHVHQLIKRKVSTHLHEEDPEGKEEAQASGRPAVVAQVGGRGGAWGGVGRGGR